MPRIVSTLVGVALLTCSGRADWQRDFPVDLKALATSGTSPYFPLRPGAAQILEYDTRKLVITVLHQTRMVDGVETRVVEERETEGETLIEISRNFFALDPATRNLYYFGEEVDHFRDGRVADHEGSWLAGEAGARFGLFLPGDPHPGYRFYQEQAPGIALDRAEILELGLVWGSDAGRFNGCIRLRETTPLEPGAREEKVYCPGIGLVQDGDLKLTGFTAP